MHIEQIIRYRGVTQTENDAAVQGGFLSLFWFYAGVWGSNVNLVLM